MMLNAPSTRSTWHERPGFHLWSGLSSVIRKLIAAGAVVSLVMATAMGLAILQMRAAGLTEASQAFGRLGIAIAEQTSRSVQAGSLVLDELRTEILVDGPETPEEFQAAVRTFTLHATLAAKAKLLPQVDAFTVIGADGKLLNSSSSWPVPPMDLSHRDDYQYFRDHDEKVPFISKPVQVGGDGKWAAYIVQRVSSRSGKFLGLVRASIELGYFQEFYQALTLGDDTKVTLLLQDGTILASYPTTTRVGDVLPASSEWYSVVKRSAGSVSGSLPATIKVESVFTPGRRLVSVHPLADYPLVVNVSVAEDVVLAHWRHAAALAAVGTGGAILCMIVLLRALTLQLQRLERSEASLAAKNHLLEATRQRMEEQANELSASQARLGEKSDALETTLGNINQGIMMVAADMTVEVCNQRAIEMLDLPPGLMASRPLFEAVVAHQRSMGEFAQCEHGVPDTVGKARIVSEPHAYERRRPNGRVLEVQSLPLPTGGMVRTYTDITERRVTEEQIRYFAHYDGLTKLVNRVVFHKSLQHAIELANRSGRSVAVFYLDLDGFKLINDTHGHGVGDQLLVQVSDRLRRTVRDVDTVARMGGDEFAIIQPLLDRQSSCESLAQRVINLVSEPIDIDGCRCLVGISIGIALYPDHAKSADDLLRHADIALYQAKAGGKGAFRLFDATAELGREQTGPVIDGLAIASSIRLIPSGATSRVPEAALVCDTTKTATRHL